MNSPLDDTARNRFFAPARKAIETAKTRRSCPEYPDEDFILSGAGRVFAAALSGRDWVQQIMSRMGFFVCMAHNLMVLFERRLEREENLRDEKSLAKRQKRLEQMKRTIRASGREPNPLVVNCTRVSQRSLQFIRWLRNALAFPTSWDAEIAQLRLLMAKYLS